MKILIVMKMKRNGNNGENSNVKEIILIWK